MGVSITKAEYAKLAAKCKIVDTSRRNGKTPAANKQPPSDSQSQYRSKWEALYADQLDWLKHIREIQDWQYEAFRVRIGEGAFYRPDFVVWLRDGRLRFIEVKGRKREAALVRFRVAKSLYPHAEWWMVRYEKGKWVRML